MQISLHATSLLILVCNMTQTCYHEIHKCCSPYVKTEELNHHPFSVFVWFIGELCCHGQNNFRAFINVQNSGILIVT